MLLDLLYDHNQIQKTQLKQTLGVGLAYNIDNGVKRSENKRNQEWQKNNHLIIYLKHKTKAPTLCGAFLFINIIPIYIIKLSKVKTRICNLL